MAEFVDGEAFTLYCVSAMLYLSPGPPVNDRPTSTIPGTTPETGSSVDNFERRGCSLAVLGSTSEAARAVAFSSFRTPHERHVHCLPRAGSRRQAGPLA